MSPDLAAVALAGVSLLFLGPLSGWLDRAAWVTRAPRSAVALWQAIGLAGGGAAVGAGLSVAVARYHSGLVGGVGDLVGSLVGGHPLEGMGLIDALGLTLAVDVGVVLLAVVAITMAGTIRARARHRRLLDLVGVGTDRVPGAVMLDDPRAAAYCLPGIRPRIVVSAGALRLLRSEELAAVVEHERGHAHERHGLVLLPLASMSGLLRRVPYAHRAPRAVAALLEMAADDHAARRHDPGALAAALVLMGTAGAVPTKGTAGAVPTKGTAGAVPTKGTAGAVPTCAFAAASTAVPARVHRLLEPRRSSRPVAVVTFVAAMLAVAVPFVPFVAR